MLNPSKRLSLAVAGAILAGTAASAAGMTGTALASAADNGGPLVPAAAQEQRQLTYGQDVSSYQPLYDWNASPAQFGIIKATEGTSFSDSAFARHWRELGKKGIVRGAY